MIQQRSDYGRRNNLLILLLLLQNLTLDEAFMNGKLIIHSN